MRSDKFRQVTSERARVRAASETCAGRGPPNPIGQRNIALGYCGICEDKAYTRFEQRDFIIEKQLALGVRHRRISRLINYSGQGISDLLLEKCIAALFGVDVDPPPPEPVRALGRASSVYNAVSSTNRAISTLGCRDSRRGQVAAFPALTYRKMTLFLQVLKIATRNQLSLAEESQAVGVPLARPHLSSAARKRIFLKRGGTIATVSDFRAFNSRQYACWDNDIFSIRSCLRLSFVSRASWHSQVISIDDNSSLESTSSIHP
ncbi:hypothetical protein EVAR_99090_1 [Eumeta japonica]|uniref:Uncharacterized protein n=1 Tax=Eumeta variegata TaxID=151549 RepID=A0A4C1ZI81_EUMVA|nr:hypothetical protein EVAR_99090_1 [Eumeta japonica]